VSVVSSNRRVPACFIHVASRLAYEQMPSTPAQAHGSCSEHGSMSLNLGKREIGLVATLFCVAALVLGFGLIADEVMEGDTTYEQMPSTPAQAHGSCSEHGSMSLNGRSSTRLDETTLTERSQYRVRNKNHELAQASKASAHKPAGKQRE
jgi:hypothetical protein